MNTFEGKLSPELRSKSSKIFGGSSREGYYRKLTSLERVKELSLFSMFIRGMSRLGNDN